MLAKILIIAGSDSGGGAGIQADIKSVSANGGYAATAITAITAQNTRGVFGVYPVPVAMIAQQIALVLEDIGADAIKTGMLHSAEVIETVAEALKPYPHIPLVVDPVMVAKGGHALLEADAIDALKTLLFPRATLITPNIPEAELLSGIPIQTTEDMLKAAVAIGHPILLKGGHLEGTTVYDLLVTPQLRFMYASPRQQTRHTHGTGCTLASAIATGLAKKLPLSEAVTQARDYVQGAIAHAPGIGGGHGPLHHFYRWEAK